MSLKKDYSIVADSEMASSPRSITSPAPIKRAARTYGRRREDPDASFTYSEQDSRDSIYKTGPPDMLDEVPPSPSEPSRLLGDDEEDDDEDADGNEGMLPSSLQGHSFSFGWRDRIKQLDEVDDFSEHLKPPVVREAAPSKEVASPANMDTNGDSLVKGSGARTSTGAASEDVLNSSLPSLISPSRLTASQGGSIPKPSPTTSRNRLRIQKNIITSDDDMDHYDNCNSRPSSPQTSSPHLIATPKSQFPSSPPTSHHDDVSANSAASSTSKGRGKISRSRHSIAPIRFPSPRPEGFDSLENATRPRSTLGLRGKKQKVKPPTKKERQETLREQARIIAGQAVSIEKPAGQERSLATLFGKLVQQKALPPAAVQPMDAPVVQHPSSPISSFTGSQPQPREDVASRPSTTLELTASNSRRSPSPLRTESKGSRLAHGNDSDSDGLPGVNGILNSTEPKEKSGEEDAQAKRQRLNAMKLQMLKRQEQQPNTKPEEDDDELQVLAPTKIEQQRKSTDKKMSTGQRMLLVNARVKNKPLVLDSRKSTKEDVVNVEEFLKQGTSDPRVLKSLLRQRAEKESLDIVKQKEEEWKRLGGAVKEEQENEQVDDAQRDQIQKGLEAWTSTDRKFEDEDVDESEDDEDDEDWSPEARGSMSPPPGCEEGEEIAYGKMEMDEADDVGTLKGDQASERGEQRFQSDDENEQVPVFKVKTKHRLRGRVVNSDESDSGEYNDENANPPKSKDQHYAASSSDDRTEDENDKENNTRLMFDRSEDKENKAVVRHQPLARLSLSFGSIFDGESDGDLSLSPPHIMTHELELGEGVGTQSSTSSHERRKPLGVISDASPASSMQRQPSTLTQAFAEQLKHSSPVRGPVDEDVFGPIPTSPVTSLDFAPIFGGNDVGKEKKAAPGFSQFSQDVSGHESFGAPALLQPGFSDLFDSSTQEDAAPLGGLRRQESLGLTQDLELQPAFQVDEKLLRKADAIFEKEQEYVVEAAGKKGVKEQELYVNDVGLLTQTRPSASRLGTSSPSLVLSPTQTGTQSSLSGLGFTQTQTQRRTSITSISSQTQSRPPLRTISLSNPLLSSPETSPKRRLRKRGETPTPRSSPVRSPVTSNTLVNTSPPPLRQINAFDVLGKASPRAKGKSKGKESALEKLAGREWLADEAEESDEDHMVGFGFVKKKDGEEDDEAVGEDLDATLSELVDDQKMDEETEGVDKVLEKHQELLEKDDEAALKFHQGVAQGELRKKRKNRLGLDDSDDEDEEDDRARRIRRKMREKTERGDIQELAANEKTAAFASVYQTGLIDDDPIETRPLDLELDFRTEREIGDEDVVMGDSQDDENQGDGTEAEEEEEDNNRYITHKDIQAQVRKMKERPEEEVEVLDFEDVSWIDRQIGDDETESMQVKMITATSKRSTANTSTAKLVTEWDTFMLGGVKRKENEKDLARARAWAKNETRNMTGSTGRLVGGIAVTGHGNKTKNGGGSLRSKVSLSSASAASLSSVGKKTLKPEGSILAGIAKRKEQFQ